MTREARAPLSSALEDPIRLQVCEQLSLGQQFAVKLLGFDAHTEKVTSFSAIASYGVMSPLARTRDEQVVLAGRVLKRADPQAPIAGLL